MAFEAAMRIFSKLNDSEAEAAETRVWLQFAVECSYPDAAIGGELDTVYDHILGKLVNMIRFPDQWTV